MPGLLRARSMASSSMRVRWPSMASPIWSASTEPTEPRSSRICSTLCATLERKPSSVANPDASSSQPSGTKWRISTNGVGLAVAVDPAVALLEPRRVPRDLPVQHPPAVALQVDAFGGGVGGHQDPHRRAGRVGLELGLGALPVVGVHAAVEGGDAGRPLSPPKPLVSRRSISHFWVSRYSVKMMTRSSFQPPPGSRQTSREPRQQRAGASVGPVAALLGPAAELVEEAPFLGGERRLAADGGGERLGDDFAALVVRGLVVAAVPRGLELGVARRRLRPSRVPPRWSGAWSACWRTPPGRTAAASSAAG